MERNILIICQDHDFIAKITSSLSNKAYNIAYCNSFKEALAKLSANKYTVLISDCAIWKENFPLEELEGYDKDFNLISMKKNAKDYKNLP
ncbi:MAG: hypothetical protein AAGU75_20505, partial [Bacillota bacterium]